MAREVDDTDRDRKAELTFENGRPVRAPEESADDDEDTEDEA